MRIAIIEFASVTDATANRDTLGRMLGELEAEEGLDLVVLPEASMYDFGRPGEDLRGAAETLEGPFVTLLAAHAQRLGAVVIGGMFEATDGLPYNTLVVLGPDGTLGATYRKIHLYDSFGYKESDRLEAGDIRPVVIDVAGIPVGLMTCYDLRFPEHARLLIDAGAQAIAVPAAWVKGDLKLEHWTTLLRARAIENTVPMLAAAQCGEQYVGHSSVIDARGSIVVSSGSGPTVLRAEIDFDEVERVRAANPSLANRRIRSEP